VAITHPYSWPQVRRGAERIVVETARSLAGRGHKVTLITGAKRRPSVARVDGYLQLRIPTGRSDGTTHEARFARLVKPILERGRFDVVHAMMPADAVAACETRPKGGHIVVYDEMGIPDPEMWELLPHAALRRRVAEEVDVYGCMSQCALTMLKETLGRDGTLIPGGVRLDEFKPAQEREPVPTILFSGAIDEPRKGVPVLVEATIRLLDEEPQARLWLSGPGSAKLMRFHAPMGAREAIVALPLGRPGDQHERYAKAWVTALPSTHESFGMTLLESLACGTPITVADHSAPPELVTAGTGTVARPWDAGSLKDALAEAVALARDPSTVERCRQRAAAYDWDLAIAPLLEGIYEQARILGRHA
jgi:phosphatidylinositol alpha-mannosyltransferase